MEEERTDRIQQRVREQQQHHLAVLTNSVQQAPPNEYQVEQVMETFESEEMERKRNEVEETSDSGSDRLSFSPPVFVWKYCPIQKLLFFLLSAYRLISELIMSPALSWLKNLKRKKTLRTSNQRKSDKKSRTKVNRIGVGTLSNSLRDELAACRDCNLPDSGAGCHQRKWLSISINPLKFSKAEIQLVRLSFDRDTKLWSVSFPIHSSSCSS